MSEVFKSNFCSEIFKKKVEVRNSIYTYVNI